MSIDVVETIRGQQYRLIKLDPTEAGRLATKVAQQLAGALDSVEIVKEMLGAYESSKDGAQTGDASSSEAKFNPLAIINDQPALLSALAGGIAKVNAEALYDCALQCVQGGRLFAAHKLHDDRAFNAWFADHPDHMLLVMVWALKVNCAGFFGLGAKG